MLIVELHQVDDWQDAWDSESNKDIDIKGIEEHGMHWYMYIGFTVIAYMYIWMIFICNKFKCGNGRVVLHN